MDLAKITQFKKLVIYAMFADDRLLERLVLKGGNAIDLIHNISARASWDLDFSIEGDFDIKEFAKMKDIIELNIKEAFKAREYTIFDFKMIEQPESISPEVAYFWGGYLIEFKIIKNDKFDRISADLDALRRNSEVIAAKQKKTFTIEISKHEFCKNKRQSEIDNLTIYVYSPTMIVVEKLRAICQQMPEYLSIVKKTHGKARARDFFDICILSEYLNINLATTENLELLKNVFAAKKVPLEFLKNVKNYREFHRPDFEVVKNTVAIDFILKEYDYYFDYVIEKIQYLQSFGII